MMLLGRPWTTRIAKNLIIMRLLCFGSLVIATPPLAHGQVERATLAGTITDNSGAVVPGVAIKVTNERRTYQSTWKPILRAITEL
jgi:hypothetical protein